jgi:NAD(P)-dependent dehydrogenase (short-subunit alcohol dehydrogenase family)
MHHRGISEKTMAGKTVLITGASAGIGLATARRFHAAGATVLAVARHATTCPALQQLAEQGRLVPLDANLADPQHIRQLAEHVLMEPGHVDVLVLNVGPGAFTPFSTTPEQVIDLVHTNLLGAMLLTQAIVPGMRARQRANIIAVAAINGHIAFDPLFAATKFGVRGFALALRRELHGQGIAVSVVSPGYVKTEAQPHPPVPSPTAEDVARAIVRLVRRPRRERVLPRYWHLAIWLEQSCPSLVDHLVGTLNRAGGSD